MSRGETESNLPSTGGLERSPTPERPPSPEPAVAPGVRLGRYTIRALLGRGGMGDVFSAHDPDLNRLVAVKVMRPSIAGRSPEARTRFQREAQALARLNHPNVVAVYDVGSFADTSFVAMELVDGPTVAAWLAAGPRRPSEVIDVFLQAGRGLAAAHAAGIIHRDFKPSNVILGERVRVVDFGLARPADGVTVEVDGPQTVLDASVTRSGNRVGTPAYMAPEQHREALSSPLSDQYSFAVSLHEALTGARPGEQPASGQPRPVPAWLRPMLDRALQARPEDRFPSMASLLQELARNPYRARRRWLALAGAALALIAAGGLLKVVATPPCAGAEARLGSVWDAQRKEAIHAAFGATRLPYAENTFTLVGALLDAYARGWLEMSLEACHSHRAEGRQSDGLFDLRMACLERRRGALRALTELWLSGVEPRVLERASEAARGLPPLAECADGRALSERVPLPVDPSAVSKIAAVREGLDTVRALVLSGRLEDAKARVPALVTDAEATEWVPVQAEALYAEGSVLNTLRDPAAEPHLLTASQLAEAAHDDRLAAEALVLLVEHLAMDHQSSERALLVADIAEAAIGRAGDDEGLRLRLLWYRGEALDTAGRVAEAREVVTQARARSLKAFGAGSTEDLASLTKLAALAATAGDNVEACRLSEENLAATSALLGPEHPRVASILRGLGEAKAHLADYDAAAEAFRRCLAILEKAAGPDATITAHALVNLGVVERRRGHLKEAQLLLERALPIYERSGSESPVVGKLLFSLANVHLGRGQLDQALTSFRRALAIHTKTYGPTHTSVAFALQGIGEVFLDRGELAEALGYTQRALEMRKQVQGLEHPLTLEVAVQLAAVLLRLGHCHEARPLLVATLAGLEKAKADTSLGLEVRGECELAEGQAAAAVSSSTAAIEGCMKTSHAAPECATKYWLLARSLEAVGKRAEAVAAAKEAERQRVTFEWAMPEPGRAALHAWLAKWAR